MINKLKWCLIWCFLMALCQLIVADELKTSLNMTEDDAAQDKAITELVDYILNPNAESQGRTFGLKRIQFMMMPMVFKMGIMITLLIVLTVISLKGLTIGIILLILKVSTILGKLFSTMRPQSQLSWSPPPPPSPPYNLHFHNEGYQHHPYGGYEGPSSIGGNDQHYYHKPQYQRLYSDEPLYYI